MLTALFDTYTERQHRHHGPRLSQVLVAVIVASFAFSAVSIGFAAGRQSDSPSGTAVAVVSAGSSAHR